MEEVSTTEVPIDSLGFIFRVPIINGKSVSSGNSFPAINHVRPEFHIVIMILTTMKPELKMHWNYNSIFPRYDENYLHIYIYIGKSVKIAVELR